MLPVEGFVACFNANCNAMGMGVQGNRVGCRMSRVGCRVSKRLTREP